MGSRRRAREYALQVLFQVDLTGNAPDAVLDEFLPGREADEEVRAFTERLVRGVSGRLEEIDRWIVASAEHWRIERMAVVDRNVLRVAVYEMLDDRATPAAVVIDEAIEIAKRYGSEASGSFINGILDSIRRRLETSRASSPPEGETAPF